MKNISKTIIIKSVLATIFVGIALLLSSCAGNKKNDLELVIGVNTPFPPYQVLNDQGEIEGFDIDVAQAIAQKLNKKLVVKDMPFDSLFIGLTQGKIDAVLAGITITNERLNAMNMVHYQGKQLHELPILFWGKIPEGVASVEDIKKLDIRTMCVQPGSLQENVVLKYSFLEVKQLDTIHDLIMDLKYGKSLAAMIEPVVVEELQKKYPEIKVIRHQLLDSEKGFGHGIGIAKGNELLTQQIKAVVEEMKADGSLDQLEKKWFKL